MLNRVISEGSVEIGKFNSLSEDVISNIMDLLSKHPEKVYLTLNISNGNYILNRISSNVAEDEFIAMRNYDRYSIGDIHKDYSYKGAINTCLNSGRFKKILKERYSSYDNIYYSLFTKVLNQPIPFDVYNSSKPVTPIGQTISEVIDEFMVCYGYLRKSISKDCAKSLQILYSFYAGLTVVGDTFVLGLHKDYRIEEVKRKKKEKFEQEVKKKAEDLNKLNSSNVTANYIKGLLDSTKKVELSIEDIFGFSVKNETSYDFWFSAYSNEGKGIQLLYNTLKLDSDICFCTTDYGYSFMKVGNIRDKELLSDVGIELFLYDDYYSHYLEEGGAMVKLKEFFKGKIYTKKTFWELISLSLEIGRVLNCWSYIALEKGKGVVYLSGRYKR